MSLFIEKEQLSSACRPRPDRHPTYFTLLTGMKLIVPNQPRNPTFHAVPVQYSTMFSSVLRTLRSNRET